MDVLLNILGNVKDTWRYGALKVALFCFSSLLVSVYVVGENPAVSFGQ